MLKEVKPILKKYGFPDQNNKFNYLGKQFYCSDDAEKWNILKKQLSDKENDKFKKGFDLLEKRFERIYDEKLLEKWREVLEREVASERFNKLFEYTKNFFDVKEENDSLTVHLLMNPMTTRTASGNADLGPKDITLEVPVFNPIEEQTEMAVGVLLHELSHLWFEKNNFYLMAKKISGKKFELIKEIIIDSIAPAGFVSQLRARASNPFKWFFSEGLADKKSKAYINWFIYPLSAKYFFGKKKLDKNFIKEVLRIL